MDVGESFALVVVGGFPLYCCTIVWAYGLSGGFLGLDNSLY
jgi:hypothetical protein